MKFFIGAFLFVVVVSVFASEDKVTRYEEYFDKLVPHICFPNEYDECISNRCYNPEISQKIDEIRQIVNWGYHEYEETKNSSDNCHKLKVYSRIDKGVTDVGERTRDLQHTIDSFHDKELTACTAPIAKKVASLVKEALGFDTEEDCPDHLVSRFNELAKYCDICDRLDKCFGNNAELSLLNNNMRRNIIDPGCAIFECVKSMPDGILKNSILRLCKEEVIKVDKSIKEIKDKVEGTQYEVCAGPLLEEHKCRVEKALAD